MNNENTILIADDSELNRDFLVELLKEQYDILEAADGKQAIEVLEDKGSIISVVILSINLPVMDGYEVLRVMKQKRYMPSIPVIVTTTDGDEESEIKSLSMGASDFIRKPYNPVIVQKRIENIISLRNSASLVYHLQKDRLTGVYSIEFFNEKVSGVIKSSSEKYAMVYSEIQNFQLLKDLYGESTGDGLLVYMAKVIKHFFNDDEYCGRIGAEHFAIFVKFDKERIEKTINEISTLINDYPVKMNLTLQFGVYVIDNKNLSVQAMCNRAILALEKIKGQYGRHVAYFTNDILEKQIREQEIVNCMEDAIREQQFQVYFQPKYALNSEVVAGAEALVRWNHPEKGFMNPGEFIPLFERNGFITELDKYVWDVTCKCIEEWREQGYPVVPISVNVSRTDIYDPDFIDIIMGILDKHHLVPQDIHLEITETAYTDNPKQIVEVVKKLKTMGFIIEMDDFGSGYSSLNMLSELPIDILKLDMGFVQGDLNNTNSNNILSFIISLAKWMGYNVVAEGIETPEQIQMLRNMDCNFVQGYYYAKPMPRREFEIHMLKNHVIGNDSKDDEEIIDGKFEKSSGVMLIADDLLLNRRILESTFEKYFEIVTVDNGVEAMNYIKDNYEKVEVIMLDLVMPVMDGFTFMKQFRKEKKYDNIPIIVTSQGSEKSVAKSFALGATDFIEKPYNDNIIIHRVQNVVAAFRKSHPKAR